MAKFMRFETLDDKPRVLYVNMDLVQTIRPFTSGSLLEFDQETSSVMVKQTPDEIGARAEWRS